MIDTEVTHIAMAFVFSTKASIILNHRIEIPEQIE